MRRNKGFTESGGSGRRIRYWLGMLAAAGSLFCLGTAADTAAQKTQLGGFQVEVEGGFGSEQTDTPQEEPEQLPDENLQPEQADQGGTDTPQITWEEMPGETYPQVIQEPQKTWTEETLEMISPMEPSPVATLSPVSPSASAAPTLAAEKRQAEEEADKKEDKKVPVIFKKQLLTRQGEKIPRICAEADQDWYLYSFQVNQREVYCQWEGRWCVAAGVQWKEGENWVEAAVRTGDGRIHYMEPWLVTL